jgi:hypothetical protein
VKPFPSVLAATLLLAGCSWSSTGHGTASPETGAPSASAPAPAATTPTATAPAATSTPSGNVPFDQRTGAEIAQSGSEAMGSLTSLRYRLSVRGGSNPTTADVRATVEGACTGTLTVGSGRIEIRGVGDQQWFKADPAAWRAISPDHSRKLIEAAGDHWVKDEGFEVANFCFFQQLLGQMFQEVGTGTWFSAGSDQVDGHDVIRVQSVDSPGVAVAAVRTDEPHYIATYQRTDDSDGAVSTGRFSEFGVDVDVAAPDDADVVDLSSLL